MKILSIMKTPLTIILIISLLSGCTAMLIGGVTAVSLAAHDRRSTGTIIDDRSIEFQVANALYSGGEKLSRSHVNVTSYNNVVLLSGEVDSPATRQWVVNKTQNIANIRHIHDELHIGPPASDSGRSSDTWITTRAKSSLLQIYDIPDFDPTRVKIVTERGNIYLLGLVNQTEGQAVAHVVRQISGVQQVIKLFEYI